MFDRQLEFEASKFARHSYVRESHDLSCSHETKARYSLALHFRRDRSLDKSPVGFLDCALISARSRIKMGLSHDLS